MLRGGQEYRLWARGVVDGRVGTSARPCPGLLRHGADTVQWRVGGHKGRGQHTDVPPLLVVWMACTKVVAMWRAHGYGARTSSAVREQGGSGIPLLQSAVCGCRGFAAGTKGV